MWTVIKGIMRFIQALYEKDDFVSIVVKFDDGLNSYREALYGVLPWRSKGEGATQESSNRGDKGDVCQEEKISGKKNDERHA